MLFRLNCFDEVERRLRMLRRTTLRYRVLWRFATWLALLKQDRAGAESVVAMSHARSEDELVMWNIQALAAAHDGRLAEAESDSRRAIELARDAGLPERAAVMLAAQAVWNSFYGNRDAARQESGVRSLKRSPDGREV